MGRKQRLVGVRVLLARVFSSPQFWCAAALVVVVGGGVLLTVCFWPDLRGGNGGPYSGTIRDMGIVIGGVVAGVMAFWRLAVSDRQAAAQEQGLLDDRFRSGTETLRSDDLAARIAGIHVLARLAANRPDEMHATVLNMFCAFVREPPVGRGGDGVGGGSPNGSIGDDVQAIMDVLGGRSKRQIRLERDEGLKLNFQGADLRGCVLDGGDLSGAILKNADLSGVRFFDVKLSGANLYRADLRGAVLLKVDLSDSDVLEANVTGARLFGVIIDQEDLDLTAAIERDDGGDGPVTGVVGAKDPHGGPVVWEGRERRVRKRDLERAAVRLAQFEEEVEVKLARGDDVKLEMDREWLERMLERQGVLGRHGK